MTRYAYRGDGPDLPDLDTIPLSDIDPTGCARMWGQVLLASLREEFADLRKARAAGRPYRVRWIGSDDFEEVCTLAGLQPDTVARWAAHEMRQDVPGRSLMTRGTTGHYVSRVRSGQRAA